METVYVVCKEDQNSNIYEAQYYNFRQLVYVASQVFDDFYGNSFADKDSSCFSVFANGVAPVIHYQINKHERQVLFAIARKILNLIGFQVRTIDSQKIIRDLKKTNVSVEKIQRQIVGLELDGDGLDNPQSYYELTVADRVLCRCDYWEELPSLICNLIYDEHGQFKNSNELYFYADELPF